MKSMDKFRIVEICPDIFEVQYRDWFGFWNRAERGYDQTLRTAQERLARVKRSFEWVPKVHA